MLSRIHVANSNPWPGGNLSDYLGEISDITDWYGINRLRLEGPYEPIVFGRDGFTYLPDEGPLAGTTTQWPRFWCAVSEGRLIVADRKSETPPALWNEEIKVRGYYDPDPSLERMIWHPIGELWNDDEIGAHKMLSNISYRLYAKVPISPKHVFLFGAGASYDYGIPTMGEIAEILRGQIRDNKPEYGITQPGNFAVFVDLQQAMSVKPGNL